MSNARELENSESPNPADDFQYLPPTPPSPDLLTSSSSDFDLQSDEDNSIEAQMRHAREARARRAEDLQGKSRSSADLQGKSRSSADLRGKSRSSADLQGKSRSSADLQGKSRSSADLQGKSRSSADLQGKSRPAADLQGKSRSAGQKSSAANSSRPLLDTNELFLQCRSRLYQLQYLYVLSFIDLLYDNSLTRDETIFWLKDIIFESDRDLGLSFQELLTSNVNEVTEFYPWTRDQVLYDQFVAFLALINIANSGKLTERTVDSLTYEGLLKLSPITSDGEKFYDSAKSRLSDEQFRNFIRAIKRSNVSGGADEMNISSVLLQAENIFGTDNKDLFLSFRELVNAQPNYPREDDEEVVSTMAEFIRTS